MNHTTDSEFQIRMIGDLTTTAIYAAKEVKSSGKKVYSRNLERVFQIVEHINSLYSYWHTEVSDKAKKAVADIWETLGGMERTNWDNSKTVFMNDYDETGSFYIALICTETNTVIESHTESDFNRARNRYKAIP